MARSRTHFFKPVAGRDRNATLHWRLICNNYLKRLPLFLPRIKR
jgi:hypothetical protein